MSRNPVMKTSAAARAAALKFDVHEAAEIFPLMQGKEFSELVADVRAHGLREPIVRIHGKVLDGRNRYRACIEAGVKPRFEEFTGKDPVRFVISLNLHRRHLNESGRALVAANVLPFFESEAKERERAGGGDKRSAKARRPGRANVPDPITGRAREAAAAALNVSPRLVQSAKKVRTSATPAAQRAVERGDLKVSAAADLAELPADRQSEILARATKPTGEVDSRRVRTEVLRVKRAAKIADIVKDEQELAAAFPDRAARFGLVLADPPWRYEHAESESRAIENQYPTMELDMICRLEVPTICMEDCVLALWTTSPKLAEAMRVIEAWGFTYRTGAVWDKEFQGMGYWFRQQHEHLLIATRGKPMTPEPSARPRSIIRIPRSSEHSEKPIEVHAMLERMFPDLPRVELFARATRPGWSVWGNQSRAA